MSVFNLGGLPAPNQRPRDFFALTGVKVAGKHAQRALPFPIPDLFRDLLLGMYLTPVLAKKHEDPLVRQLYHDVRLFNTHLVDALATARKGSQIGKALVDTMLGCPECNELRYGYSLDGSDGLGWGGGKLSTDVSSILLAVPEFAVVAVDHPDVLALLPNVSIDRMGDYIGSVAKNSLIALTQRFAKDFYFDPACMKFVDVPGVWDSKQMRYVTRRNVLLPVADDGRAILLSHKETVRSSPPLRAKQFAWYVGGRRDMDKADVVRYVAAHPGRLRDFANDILAEDWRHRPRRDFR